MKLQRSTTFRAELLKEAQMMAFRLSVLALFALSGVQASAGVIVNGDFSDSTPLAGFTATGTIAGEPAGGFAQLETDGSPLRTLEQTFVIPVGATSLSFDYQFSTEAILGSPPSGPDSFAASLITTIDGEFLDLFVVDLLGAIPDPSDGIESITGALPISVSLDPGVTIPGFSGFASGTTSGGRVTLSFPTTVLGEESTLYFDLLDNDGLAFSSIAAIDNVTVSSASGVIPEPTSFAVWGLLMMTNSMRRRRKTAA
nr:hypothetical protein [Rhodopirellula sp. SM50]